MGLEPTTFLHTCGSTASSGEAVVVAPLVSRGLQNLTAVPGEQALRGEPVIPEGRDEPFAIEGA
jgi:hypothetical protein